MAALSHPAADAVAASTYRFIDIGANMTDDMFRGRYNGRRVHEDDYGAVMERAKKTGVERVIITAGQATETEEALELIANTGPNAPQLYTTVGCHPTRCKQFEAGGNPEAYLAKLLALAKEHPQEVVAIGECGLDYDRLHFCPKETQLKYFEWQFQLAEQTGLPMFLHDRNTGDDFYRLIKANRSRFGDGVVHSFTGTWEECEKLLDLGLYIGINGCSLKTEANLQVVARIPAQRLMLETDAPWCSIKPTHASHPFVRTQFPTQKREKYQRGYCVRDRCEPCHILYGQRQVLQVASAVRGVSEAELAHVTYENTKRVFFSAPPGAKTA